MKRAKKGLAVLLAALMLIPSVPTIAAGKTTERSAVVETVETEETKQTVEEERPAEKESAVEESSEVSETKESDGTKETTAETKESTSEAFEETETSETVTETEETETEETEEETKESSEKKEKATEPEELVIVNTGSFACHVVGRKDFEENELGDDCFDEAGNYTIQIPEENPFFPYQVQFTYEGETTCHWFMNPEDSFTLGGHRFTVSAYFDGTVITQMTLEVGGQEVVVYPQEKEFTEGDGAAPMSLLPLEERYLSVDMRGYTPLELSMVSVKSIFTGKNELKDTDKLIWRYDSKSYEYKISEADGYLDLAYGMKDSTYRSWEIITGEADQLAQSNIRYSLGLHLTKSAEWLIPSVYAQDSAGNRNAYHSASANYSDSLYTDGTKDRELKVGADRSEFDQSRQSFSFMSLKLNKSIFENTKIDEIRAYAGSYTSAAEAETGTDITDQLFCSDMSVKDAGYTNSKGAVTLVAKDVSGNTIGCLSMDLEFLNSYNSISGHLYKKTSEGYEENVDYTKTVRISQNKISETLKLWKGYATNDPYRLDLDYYDSSSNRNNKKVVAAYVGEYETKDAAEAAGKQNIRDLLFENPYGADGYQADFGAGVTFSIFVEEDGFQRVFYYQVKTVEGDAEKGGTYYGFSASFYGLKDRDGKAVTCYMVDSEEDSYSEFNYLTILVDKDTDITALAPVFNLSTGSTMYAEGSSTAEVSGKSLHDFSNGCIEYTVSSGDGSKSQNYWLNVVKAKEGAGELYINSLSDPDASTRTENGTIYSEREVMVDSYHKSIHDILVVNRGTETISNLAAELSSDTLELDRYWTLSGNHDLAGQTSVKSGEFKNSNLAKVRLKVKDGVANGTEISGTLTIKDGSRTLMVLTLTGSVGDPCITTKDIPEAVKYVPYGTMIQNSNKYSDNHPEYRLLDGKLPEGMVIRENGEIYGVPKESGEFTFTVVMQNNWKYYLSSSIKTYTLRVLENTDPNVDGATDQGYDLTERVQNVDLNSSNEDQLMVSQGV